MTRSAAVVRKVCSDLRVHNADSIVAIRRTRAGVWQRAQGAWSWYAVDVNGYEVVGSQWNVTDIARAHPRGLVVVADQGWHGAIADLIVENDGRQE